GNEFLLECSDLATEARELTSFPFTEGGACHATTAERELSITPRLRVKPLDRRALEQRMDLRGRRRALTKLGEPSAPPKGLRALRFRRVDTAEETCSVVTSVDRDGELVETCENVGAALGHPFECRETCRGPFEARLANQNWNSSPASRAPRSSRHRPDASR